MIDKYLQNTHASTHNQYKMKILDVFDVGKHGEDSKFNDCGNRWVCEIQLNGNHIVFYNPPNNFKQPIEKAKHSS